jgi:hypothetical protein
VWTPRNMGYRWRPYSDGQWILTDYGWTWNSHEEWGSIPFHYGRWGYDNDFGWFWVPDTVWGPAWVSWRWSDQYVGWAPLPPGVEFRADTGFASLSFKIPNRFWVFLQGAHFMDRDIYRYTLPYERNGTIINFTSFHHNIRFNNNRIFNEGIGIDYVQRVTRRKVSHFTVQDDKSPRAGRVEGNNVHLYRPNFRENSSAKPKNFLHRDEARQKLTSVKVYEPRSQPQQTSVQKRQAQENALLKATQKQELEHIKNKRAKELSQIRDNAEKVRILKDNQRKIDNLRKQHQVETERFTKRNKQDFEQVKKVEQQRKRNSQQQTIKNNKNEKKNKDKNKNK